VLKLNPQHTRQLEILEGRAGQACRSPSTLLFAPLFGIIATALLTDYTNKDISAEYAGV
jgi:hypothetical protein